MKSLKPSHREKKRYLLLEGKDADKKKIEESILEYAGILGYVKASPKIVSKSENRVILAVNRKELDKIRASFLLSGREIKILRVSGSLKKLK